jgi:VWFA-related protein
MRQNATAQRDDSAVAKGGLMRITSNNTLPRTRLFRAVGILGLLSCLSLLALPGSRPSAAQTAGVNLRVDVELVTVEVMVLDKKGHPVRNLTREGFQLFEDGKKQEIVTFAEISDDPGSNVPTSLADVDENGLMRGKMVLILFDDSHIAGSRLQLARESAEKYVKEQMRPVDFFAVASYGMSLKLLQNFTHDAGKVVEAIHQPAMSFVNPVQTMQGAGPTGAPGAPDGAPRPGMMQPGGMEAGYRATALSSR